jgi:hypothetical protein
MNPCCGRGDGIPSRVVRRNMNGTNESRRKAPNVELRAYSIALAAAAHVDPKTARRVLEQGTSCLRSRPIASAIESAAASLGIPLPSGAA